MGYTLFIVVTKLCNVEVAIGYFINQPVFIIDSPRPITGKSVFQRFGFSCVF